MTGVALLDVNVLLALFDPDHVHHEAAHAWFAEQRGSGWATCPQTEGACLRILANPAYTGSAMRVIEVAERLAAFQGSGQHVHWTADMSPIDPARFRLDVVRGHRQLADVYLLGLAVRHDGRLATFDRSIPMVAVKGARPAHLALIPA